MLKLQEKQVYDDNDLYRMHVVANSWFISWSKGGS